MSFPFNPAPGSRTLLHERLQTYNLGAHTLEVIEDPTDPTARVIRLTTTPSSALDVCDTVAEEVCLSWEEAYKLLSTLHALFCQQHTEG